MAPTLRPRPLTIRVNPVNKAPTFVAGGNVVLLEDSGTYFAQWATSISPGDPLETNQAVHFEVTCTNPSLFLTPPSITAAGASTFILTPDAYGVSVCSAVARDDGLGTAPHCNVSAPSSFTISVVGVNDMPRFVKPSDLYVLQAAGLQHVSAWVRNMSVGPSNEASQTYELSVVELPSAPGTLTSFDLSPRLTVSVVDAAATLEYKLNDAFSGVAQLSVCMQDSGGTENGGVDKYCTPFAIVVSAVNQKPTFVAAKDVTILEGSSPTLKQWLTQLSPGFGEESRQSVASATLSCAPNSILLAAPIVSQLSDLSIRTAQDAYGDVTCNVTAQDNLGLSSSEPVSIHVLPVNDAPTFSALFVYLKLKAGDEYAGLFSNSTSAGPANEAGQKVWFTVLVADNVSGGYLASTPWIDAAGFFHVVASPAVSVSGAAKLLVTLHDDGGTSNGGVDASSDVVLTVWVEAPVLPFTWTPGPPVVVLEDQGTVRLTWVTQNQDVNASFVAAASAPGLFSSLPMILMPSGVLQFSTAQDRFGMAYLNVVATNKLGVTVAANSTITIINVNDPPGFSWQGAALNMSEDTTLVVGGWATSISAGPFEDAIQTVRFTFAYDKSLLSDVELNTTSGQLTVIPVADAYGSCSLVATISDNGGTENGGGGQEKCSCWRCHCPATK